MVTEAPLYLDTARLGRMLPKARAVQTDFLRFGEDLGAPSSLERVLIDGGGELSNDHRNRYPNLARWPGMRSFLGQLQAYGQNDSPPILATRSRAIVELACRLAVAKCERLMVTDVGWPAWQELLISIANRSGREVVLVGLRDNLTRERLVPSEIVNVLADAYRKHDCHGLFLPTISHDGFRLPVASIITRLEKEKELRFSILDGSQEFGQAPPRIAGLGDFYIAGTHKWFGSYFPVGVGYCGQGRTRHFLDATIDRWISLGKLDDPLMTFSRQLIGNRLDGRTETVNLSGLFACFGALEDASSVSIKDAFCQRLTNGDRLAEVAMETPWQTVPTDSSIQSGILILKPRSGNRVSSGGSLRNAFRRHGVALTAYDDGSIRLSMPDRPWQPRDINRLRKALCAVS